MEELMLGEFRYPIPFVSDMYVKECLAYSIDGINIYRCIKYGCADNIHNEEYFTFEGIID